jgi:superfamily I DNA/RNA helicase
MFDQIRPGDFVISRTNAPLVAACMHALSRGIPSAVVGRDVGGTLMNLVKKMKASNVKELEERLQAWLQKEVAKFSAKVPVNEAAIEVATDKVESLLAIISDCDDMAAVQTKIETLFVADASESRVDFTTTHKAKGRERARVFLFRDTFLLPKRNKTTGEWLPPSEEEYNLLYVAITRAKNELVYVDGARKLGKAA